MIAVLQKFVEILTVCILVGGVVYGVYWFFTNQNAFTESRIQATFETYQASAGIHQGRYGEYAGVCGDIGLPDTVVCTASRTTYRMFERVETGGFQCIDQTGFNGVIAEVPRSSDTCQ